MKYLAFLVLFLGLPLLALAQTTADAGTGFIPLTNVPFLTETGNAFSLETFLNGLYRISIGIAAVVAVLQIMRAGIMYMGSDSGFAEKKEAKNLIALAIGGLILVLSPVVVFSVINPEILKLKIGNIEKLVPGALPTCEPACSAGSVCSTGNVCVSVAGQGDGTCSQNCDAEQGKVCRSGQCVAIDENTCPVNGIPNGTSVPNERGQRCCAAQTGCTVTAQLVNGVSISTCSCQQAPAASGTNNAPGPQSFKIAYKSSLPNNDACVGYINETHPDMDACIVAEGVVGNRLSEQGVEFQFTKRCINREQAHRFKDLPACTQ